MHLRNEDLILRVEGLKKVFRSGESDLVLFENLSFEVKRGEMLAIVGESGAGKSTLLHILSALDRASAGDVYCAHLRVNSLSQDEAAAFRNRETGFVWQFHYLLPEFTAAENVAMPLADAGSDMATGRTGSFTVASPGWTRAARPSPLRRAFGRGAAASSSGQGADHWAEIVAGRRTHGRPGRTDGGSSFLIDCSITSRAPTYLPHRYAQFVIRPSLPSRTEAAAGPCGGNSAGVASGMRLFGEGGKACAVKERAFRPASVERGIGRA